MIIVSAPVQLGLGLGLGLDKNVWAMIQAFMDFQIYFPNKTHMIGQLPLSFDSLTLTPPIAIIV